MDQRDVLAVRPEPGLVLLHDLGAFAASASSEPAKVDCHDSFTLAPAISSADVLNNSFGGTGSECKRGSETINLNNAFACRTCTSTDGGSCRFFGEDMDLADINGDGLRELIIGSPSETVLQGSRAIERAGIVHIYMGDKGATGIADTGTTILAPDPQAGQGFGTAVAAAATGNLDQDGHGKSKLVVGAPGLGGHVYLFRCSGLQGDAYTKDDPNCNAPEL